MKNGKGVRSIPTKRYFVERMGLEESIELGHVETGKERGIPGGADTGARRHFARKIAALPIWEMTGEFGVVCLASKLGEVGEGQARLQMATLAEMPAVRQPVFSLSWKHIQSIFPTLSHG